MANTLKLIIPLIANFDKKILDEKYGFVDAYSNDINKPQNDRHIFLLFKHEINNYDHYIRDKTLLKNKMLHSHRGIRLNKEFHILYTFHANSSSINKIKDGWIPTNKNELFEIFKFWCFDDDFINKLLFNRTIKLDSDISSVPEEDYYPEFTVDDLESNLYN